MFSKKVTFFDFETTGVDPKTCSVVSFAAMTPLLNGQTEQYYEEYDIDGEIPESASSIHGITKQQLLGQPHFSTNNEAIQLLNDAEWIAGYNNFRYDNVIAKRYGMKFKPCVDVYNVIKCNLQALELTKAGKLGEMYTVFTGKEPENAHNALADVYMTYEIMLELVNLLGEDKVFKQIERKQETDFMMTIGKYKGIKKFSEIVKEDKSYAYWVYQNCDYYKNSDFYMPIMKKLLEL